MLLLFDLLVGPMMGRWVLEQTYLRYLTSSYVFSRFDDLKDFKLHDF